MRKPLIAGNWKMNKTISEGVALAQGIRRALVDFSWSGCEVVLCPPFTALRMVSESINASGIQVGAQDVHWEQDGAFTGEISCSMLKDAGCVYVIIGHSERRQLFGETDETVNLKLKTALEQELSAIVCVGETLKQRDEQKTLAVIEEQVRGAFRQIDGRLLRRIVIAYEPVWAIGTGRTATPEQAQEVHVYIRSLIGQLYGEEAANKLRILYGGSVKPENLEDLIFKPDIDGALVGGASLKEDSFVDMVRKACRRV